ncbi:MAG TPA: hypothetical protein VHZ96_26205 [Frankiaceae bacterium]|jgi:hypothetical protein|nr:hypothetical protein [Frankiaceae bacterium]
MATVTVLATGESITAEGPLLAYYRGEAATVGGYSIDGVDYPRRTTAEVIAEGDQRLSDLTDALGEMQSAGDGAAVAGADLADATDALTEAVPVDDPDDHPSPKPH